MLVQSQRLIAKEQHAMIEKCSIIGRPRLVVDLFAQIDPRISAPTAEE